MTELQALAVALTMGLTEAVKLSTGRVPVLRHIPIFVYAILIAGALVFGLDHLGFLPPDVSVTDMVIETMISAAGASGLRDWWQNRKVTPLHRSYRK